MDPAIRPRSSGRAVPDEPNADSEVRRALYEATPYIVVVALYVLSGLFVFGRIGRGIPFRFTDIYRTPALLTALYLVGTFLVAVVVDVFAARRRPGDPQTWSRLYHRRFGTRRMVGTLIVLATLPALLDIMIGYRISLTDIHDFRFDALFMATDRWLHFGFQPWELLQPIVGRGAITVLIDRGYVFGWFGFLWMGVIWQAVHGRPDIRLQFFLSFALAWMLLGTLAAILLSSAGPVYFGRVTGLADPYAPLFDYLYTVHAHTPLNALQNQERLWLSYLTWGGITAMPSMHLAITTVVALAAIQTIRKLAWVVAPLWLLMLVGSVHLGWHYAIDSYAGILGACLIWVVAGRFSRWWLGRRASFAEAPA